MKKKIIKGTTILIEKREEFNFGENISNELKVLFHKDDPLKIEYFDNIIKYYDPVFGNDSIKKELFYNFSNGIFNKCDEIKEENNYIKFSYHYYTDELWKKILEEENVKNVGTSVGNRGIYLYRNNVIVKRVDTDKHILPKIPTSGDLWKRRHRGRIRCKIEYYTTNDNSDSIDKIFNVNMNKSQCSYNDLDNDIKKKLNATYKLLAKTVIKQKSKL